MYEDYTVEMIKNNIISQLSSELNTSEGSYTNDMISAVAYEMWKYYQAIDAIVPIAYVDETSGEYIDKRCAEYGITRKSGSKATTMLTFTGANNTQIAAGKVFLTSDGLQFETDKAVTISEGTVSVSATAAEIGDEYNVDAGTILYQVITINGLTSVTNAAATGGADEETDAALIARLYDYLQKPATSGNIANYRQWALAVDGVGGAKVFPLWKGNGTVKVVIVDSDKQPVAESLVTATEKYIEEMRPIGATVTVVSGTAKNIDITASVTLASGYILQTVTDTFTQFITDYFKEIAFDATYISVAKIGTLLLGTDGVLDYDDLRLNSDTSNIGLGDEEVPVFGTVDLEV